MYHVKPEWSWLVDAKHSLILFYFIVFLFFGGCLSPETLMESGSMDRWHTYVGLKGWLILCLKKKKKGANTCNLAEPGIKLSYTKTFHQNKTALVSYAAVKYDLATSILKHLL